MAKIKAYDTEQERFTMAEEPDPSIRYTYADYLSWTFEEQMEIIRGKIFRMSPAPSPLHQRISYRLNGMFYNRLKKQKCQAFSAPFDVRLPVGNKKKDDQITTVVQPDLCVICDETKIDNRGCCGAPDLVVEILSPGNSHKDVKLKQDVYEKAGVLEYWIIHPAEQTIAVLILNEDGRYNGALLYAGKEKITSTAIQGLTINLKELFSE
jgi:Uma2 family endonuclease